MSFNVLDVDSMVQTCKVIAKRKKKEEKRLVENLCHYAKITKGAYCKQCPYC